jgi:D-alanyl-D-alanine endopeptidase (penicillin-binding protein 7)
VRLIRPVLTVKSVSTLVGVGLCLSLSAAFSSAAQSDATTQPKTTTTTSHTSHKASAKTTSKRTAYSAKASNARKTTLARARASARAREQARLNSLASLRAAMTPHYKLDENGQEIPDLQAAAAVIFNPVNGQILYEENSQEKRSIASITKVMTALVYLEDNPDLDQTVTIERSDVFAASTTYLRANDQIKASELLHLLLIASDNAAARALARTSHGGTASFVERMNEKAIELGLQNTSFVEPSGLNANDMSSAFDLSHLITFAASDDRISSIMRTPEYTVTTNRRMIPIRSTNHLVRDGDVDVLGAKTGFISKSGYCLATLLRLPQGDPIAVVVLGAHSNNGRFWEVRHLFTWLESKAGDVIGKQEIPK